MVNELAVRLTVAERQSVSAVWTRSVADPTWCFIYAPGAGANLRDGFGMFVAERLAEAGIMTLRFQFPYTEAGRKIPDRPPVLEATWRAAVTEARPRAARLVAGGRSMGGRIASQVVAAGEPVDALALFAYPLHPPGQPQNRRDGHLSRIAVPTLFCSGTRDPFAAPEELEQAAVLVPRAQIHPLEGADHGFRVARGAGRGQRDVWSEAAAALMEWLMDLETPPR